MAGVCVAGQLMAAGPSGPPLPSWPPSLRDGQHGLGLGRRRRRMWSGAMALSMAICCLLLIVTPVGGAATVPAAGAAEAGACTTESCPAPPSPANSTPPASDPPAVKEEPKKAVKPPDQPVRPPKVQNEVNYASITAGAVVLDHSEALIGSSSLLDDNKDKYARSPCDQAKWVVINLSEDIRVQTLVLANYEKFSSLVKDFQVFYSITMPKADEDWKLLGNFTGKEKQGEQRFIVEKPEYARYLKVSLMTHYGKEFFCTLSQIKVHGSTLQQGFMDDWEKQKKITGDQLTAIRPQQSAEAGIPEAGSTPVEGTGGNGSTAGDSRLGEAVAAEVNPIPDVPVPKANLSGGVAAEGAGGEERKEEKEAGREEKEGAGVAVPLPVGGGSSGPGATGSADEATPLPKDTKPAPAQATKPAAVKPVTAEAVPTAPAMDGKPKAAGTQGGESKPATQEGQGAAVPGAVGGATNGAASPASTETQPPAAPTAVPAVEVEKVTPEAPASPLPVVEPVDVVTSPPPPKAKDVAGLLFSSAAASQTAEGSVAAPVPGTEAPKQEGKPPVVPSTAEPVAPSSYATSTPRSTASPPLEPTVSATVPSATVASEPQTVGSTEASPQVQAPAASPAKPAVPSSSAATEPAATGAGKAVEPEPAPMCEEKAGEAGECEMGGEQVTKGQEQVVVDPATAEGVGKEPLVAAENATGKGAPEAEPVAVKVGSVGAGAEGVASDKEAAQPTVPGGEEAGNGPVGVVHVEKVVGEGAKAEVAVEAGATVVVNTTNGPPMPPATIPAIPPVRILGRPLSHQHDGLARVRHRCLEQLGLAEFKRQKLAMLKDSGEEKPGGPVVGGGGSPYDNIFRTLMNEIASLEINQSIFDVYVSSLHNCVVQVVEEMRMDSERTTHELHEAIESLAYRVRVLSEVNESYLVKLNDLENRVFVSCAGGFLSLCSLGLLVLVLCWQFVFRRRQPAKY